MLNGLWEYFKESRIINAIKRKYNVELGRAGEIKKDDKEKDLLFHILSKYKE